MNPLESLTKPTDIPKSNYRLPLIHKDNQESNERKGTLISFFAMGCLVSSTFVVLLSAAEDILAGSPIQTSIVLLANRGPSSLISLIAPYFMKRIPYSIRFAFVFAASVGGFLVTGLFKAVEWKLAGVALASLDNGVASISCIALASFFDIKSLSMYSTGTGLGFIAAPLYYTAITTWLCVAPNIAILVFMPLTCLYIVAYIIVNRNLPETDLNKSTFREYNYTKLTKDDEDDFIDRRDSIALEKLKEEPERVEKVKKNSEFLTTREKLSVIMEMMFRCFVPVFIGFFSQYMLLQAVITTLSYQNAPFPPRDHYQYYIFIYMVGEFLGCHRSVLRLMSSQLLYEETSLKLWLVSLAQVIHVVFFAVESWYRFLPGVGLALFITFTAGVAVGILFNNMLEYLSVALEGRKREFMLGYISFPMFCGSFVAALVGISVENVLRIHCQFSISDSSFCLTRASSFVNFTSSCH